MVPVEATKTNFTAETQDESGEPYKLAWSSFNTNAIRTYDSKLKITTEVNDGAQITTTGMNIPPIFPYRLQGFAYTIIDALPQADCLLSSISNDNISNFVMLTMGKKPKAVYQLGTVEGSKLRAFQLYYNFFRHF